MKKVLALALIGLGLAFTLEAATGRDLGIARGANFLGSSVTGGFAGGYGASLGVAGSVGR